MKCFCGCHLFRCTKVVRCQVEISSATGDDVEIEEAEVEHEGPFECVDCGRTYVSISDEED